MSQPRIEDTVVLSGGYTPPGLDIQVQLPVSDSTVTGSNYVPPFLPDTTTYLEIDSHSQLQVSFVSSGECADVVVHDAPRLNFTSRATDLSSPILEFDNTFIAAYSPPVIGSEIVPIPCAYQPPLVVSKPYLPDALEETAFNCYSYDIPGLSLTPFNCVGFKEVVNDTILCSGVQETGEGVQFLFDCFTGEYSGFDVIQGDYLSGVSSTGEYVSSSIITYQSIPLEASANTGEYSQSAITISKFIPLQIFTGEESTSSVEVGKPVVLGISSGFDGEYSDSLLSMEVRFGLSGYSGESSTWLFDTHPPIVLDIVQGYTGQSSTALFQSSIIIPAVIGTGESSVADLLASPSIVLGQLHCGDGSNSILSLSAQASLFGPIESGESSASSIETFSSLDISFSFYSGETGSYNVATTAHMGPSAYTDESVFYDIVYTVNQGTPIEIGTGENVSGSLSVAIALSGIGYTGETGRLALAAEEPLGAVLTHSGEYSSSTLVDNPVKVLALSSGTGEYSASVLSFITTLPSRAYCGNSFSVDIQIAQTAPISCLAHTGEAVTTSLQTGIKLGSVQFYSGETSSLQQITNEPNIRLYTGEGALSSLSISCIISTAFSEGTYSTTSLYTKPSEPLGVLAAYTGETQYPGLDTLVSANLEIRFYERTFVQCDIDSQTYFDLQTDACCGQRKLDACGYNFELSFAPMPDEHYSRESDLFFIDLYTRQNFSFDFYSGEFSSEVKQYSAHLGLDDDGQPNIKMFDGTACEIRLNTDAGSKLCKGFFIPDGDNIETELTDVLVEDCPINKAYTGETMYAVLSIEDREYIHWQSGEEVHSYLTTTEPWLLRALDGENMFFNFKIEVVLPIRETCTGESSLFTFEPAVANGWDGEYSTAAITTEISIEFLEAGCLENEYRYFDEDGREIEEQIPIAMEEKQFLHDIKARCF